MSVSDLHLRSEQCCGIILFGYPYEKKKKKKKKKKIIYIYTFKFGADLRVNIFLAH